LAWLRGLQTHQHWLLIMPLLALAFDLIPGLNWIYLMPTILHMAAISAGGFLRTASFMKKSA